MSKTRFVPEQKVEEYSGRWREHCGRSNPINKKIFKRVINLYFKNLGDCFIEKGKIKIYGVGKAVMETYRLVKPKMIKEGVYSTNAIRCYYLDDHDTNNVQLRFNKKTIARAYRDFDRALVVYKRQKNSR